MNNDEIKALLRELKERSDRADEVKSETIRINFEEEPDAPVHRKSRKAGVLRRRKSSDTGVPKQRKTPEADASRQRKPAEEEETSEARSGTSLEPEGRSAEASSGKRKPAEPEIRIEETASKKKEATHISRKRPGKIERFWANLRYVVSDFFADLRSRGIGAKELIMLAIGVLLLGFIVFAIVASLHTEKSSENVTADEGLTVVVEQEPEEWCSQGTVVLSVRAASQIQSVTVNGNAFEIEAGRRAEISLEAESEKLDLMVVTEEKVLQAQVELSMIDSGNPLVSVRQENGQVTISAVDERSGVEGIYYGTSGGLSNIPEYEAYTGPFAREPGRTYYYYARDNAGNRTVPVATNMEPAEALVLNETEKGLFPGESFSLRVSSSPSMAYYNNLQMTNQTPDIISLAADGTVTALKDGIGLIEVTADGLSPVTCRVQVHSEATVTVSAIGDCTLGSDIYFGTANSFDAVWESNGSSYFFRNVRDILSGDDVTFANLEGTLTTSDQRENKEYAFKGRPEYTDILKDGSVEVVTLANNHSSDYGEQSLADTKQYLTAAGIDYCIGDEIAIKDVNGVRMAFIGIYVLDAAAQKSEQVRSTIAAAKDQGAKMIIASFHWGTEKSEWPDEVQTELAHLAIDCGADLVVGHHPHVLQGIEMYQGKYIVYSLANFCFGGNSTPSDKDTMIFQQTFAVSDTGAEDRGIRVIPCSVSSEAGWNNYQPTPAQGAEAERILERINEHSAQYGVEIPAVSPEQSIDALGAA